MVWMGVCNAAHKDHKKNIALAIKNKIGGNVWASDGSVSYRRLGYPLPYTSHTSSGYTFFATG